MAAVTKNLAFGITASTSFEQPFLLAKRFSTLDHLTNGRIGWNIVTSYKKAAFKAIGVDTPIEHDQRYAQADEYLRVLYKYTLCPTDSGNKTNLLANIFFPRPDFGMAPGPQMPFRQTQKQTRTSIPTRSVRLTIKGSSIL
jgi:alkanesulfonate monooxygenase SsuD/methylene tetrahydromethanopterin reductase-like flavin-dependent oxidoreductase (luciferase family)